MRKTIRETIIVAALAYTALPAIMAEAQPSNGAGQPAAQTPIPPTPPPVTTEQPAGPAATEAPPAAAETPAATDEADTNTANACNASVVNGTYGLQIQGSRIQGRKLIPYIAVRTAKFDGDGKTTGQGMVNVGGRVMQYTVDGSYTVNDDCSITIEGTQTFGENSKPEPYKQFGVLVNGGDEILIMQSTGPRSQFGRYERY